MKKYKQIYDSEWVDLPKWLFIRCCDCGLVHFQEVRRHKGKLQYRVTVDKRKTSATRRARKLESKAATQD